MSFAHARNQSAATFDVVRQFHCTGCDAMIGSPLPYEQTLIIVASEMAAVAGRFLARHVSRPP
jgi:hypothetical protein